MHKVLKGAHQSAAEFHGLAVQIIGDTAVPGPETQVHEQVPTNGLYFRQSGRLLTSQPEGNFIQRVRTGYKLGKLFELQRVGSVTRQTPQIETGRRINPVHSIDPKLKPSYVAMRWIDEEGLHQVTPQNEKGNPCSVTVQSWLEGVVMEPNFLQDASGSCNRKVISAEPDDPALALYYAALSAYTALSSPAA